ncbi:MAG: NUDIX domain-containing protein [Flavobacteriales bacterium]|nr:NUDIX domain-containing protein [Flavobacteriales bacterium]
MYEVFIKSKRILLKESKQNNVNFSNPLELNKTVLNFIENKAEVLDLECVDLKEAWRKFKKIFLYIKASGGLIFNEKEEFLVIKRKGFWDLPKGKIDPGEKKKKAALREVEEETGVIIDSLGKEYPSTYHIYHCPYNKKLVLKRTFWFQMFADSKQALVPQEEEDITNVFWLPWEEKTEFIEKTYPTLSSLLREEND